MKNDFIKKFILKGIKKELEKDTRIIDDEELKNYKVIKLNAETDEEIAKNEKDLKKNQILKSNIKKIFEKRTLKNSIKKCNYNLKNRSCNYVMNNQDFAKIQELAKKVAEKALKVVTYHINKKWNLKNDKLIIDYFCNSQEKEDVVSFTIENFLNNGIIAKNILYIKNKTFKSLTTEKILYNRKNYKKINSYLYYKKLAQKNEILDLQKNNNDDEFYNSDIQALNDYIKKMYIDLDLKNQYKLASQKMFCKNVIKLLELTPKQKIVYNLYLQGIKQVKICEILGIKKAALSRLISRINDKIENIKKELCINV